MRYSRQFTIGLLFGVVFGLAACSPSGDGSGSGNESVSSEATSVEDEASSAAGDSAESESRPAESAQTVDVTGREYSFSGPDSVPSGWNTFRLINEGGQHHFLLIYELPEGVTQADVQEEAVPVYDRVMLGLQNGEMDKAGALAELGEALPEWFFTLDFRGGPGLVAPGGVSQATVNLEKPGNYLMECYVKGPDGRFHSSMGMQKAFTVTEEASGVTPPEPDFRLTLSTEGIRVQGEPVAGKQVVQVEFAEDPPGGFPYDVHLARLEEDTDISALRAWMDWMNVGGLKAPAPASFVGGAENMAAGNIAYFTVNLEPGRYAWLSEVGAENGMYEEFTVEE